MKSEDQKLIDQLLSSQQGSLDEEYQQELSYRFAQEARLRIQKQYSSVSDFAETNGLDRHQLSRQLSGSYNLTLKSIARIAAALKEPLMNVCGLPSYRFEEVKLPVYSFTAKENRMERFNPTIYSMVHQKNNALPLGKKRGEEILAIKSRSETLIIWKSRPIDEIEYQPFEEVQDSQMQLS